jgi:hypothetical protein
MYGALLMDLFWFQTSKFWTYKSFCRNSHASCSQQQVQSYGEWNGSEKSSSQNNILFMTLYLNKIVFFLILTNGLDFAERESCLKNCKADREIADCHSFSRYTCWIEYPHDKVRSLNVVSVFPPFLSEIREWFLY